MSTGQKLKLDENFYWEETTIFGLISEIPAYRLCYFLNEALGLRLKRGKEDKIFLYKKGGGEHEMRYSHFEYEDEKQGVTWFLTANKNPVLKATEGQVLLGDPGIISGLPLVPGLKIIDYFFWIEGEIGRQTVELVKAILKKIPYVRTLQEIHSLTVKDIYNLLLH